MTLTVAAFVATIIVGWVLWAKTNTAGLSAISVYTQQWADIARVTRWTSIVVLAATWNLIAHALRHAGAMTHDRAAQLNQAKPRILIWIVLLELTVGGTANELLQLTIASA